MVHFGVIVSPARIGCNADVQRTLASDWEYLVDIQKLASILLNLVVLEVPASQPLLYLAPAFAIGSAEPPVKLIVAFVVQLVTSHMFLVVIVPPLLQYHLSDPHLGRQFHQV